MIDTIFEKVAKVLKLTYDTLFKKIDLKPLSEKYLVFKIP